MCGKDDGENMGAPGRKLRNTSTSCQLGTTLISEVLAWEEPHISYHKLKVGSCMTSSGVWVTRGRNPHLHTRNTPPDFDEPTSRTLRPNY